MHPAWQRIVAGVVCSSVLSLLLGGCPPKGEPNDPNANGDPNQPAPVQFVEVPDPLSGDNPTYKLIAANPLAPGQAITDSRLGGAQVRVTQTHGVLPALDRAPDGLTAARLNRGSRTCAVGHHG